MLNLLLQLTLNLFFSDQWDYFETFDEVKFDSSLETKPHQIDLQKTLFVAAEENSQFVNQSKKQEPSDKLQKNYICEICGRSYVNKGSLSRHKKYECGVDPKFVCDYCEYTSKRKHTLLVHIISRHLKTEKNNDHQDRDRKQQQWKYKCDKCGRNYAYKRSLCSHKQNECGLGKKFSCLYCGYKTKRKNDLLMHMSRRH